MADVSALKETVIGEIDQVAERLIAISREIHKNPELGFEEYEASKKLITELEKHGFSVERELADLPTAFWAGYTVSDSGRQIVFLAEYDALPGIGHGCGHNLICTAAIGAAIGLRRVMNQVEGRIAVIGTPAEENGGGKAILAERGKFDKVDFALLAHPYSANVVTRATLAMKTVQVDFYGTASHAAAAPEKGRNALEGVISTFNNINALRQYIRGDGRIHGIITKGGTAVNVIPDHASAVLSVRAKDKQYATELLSKLEDCVQAAALATGTKADIKLLLNYDNFVPNYAFAHAIAKNLEKLGIQVREPIEGEGMASTDIGNVSQIVPTINAYFQIGTDIVQHSTEFALAAISAQGEQAMIQVAKGMAMTAVDVFTDAQLVRTIRREFVEHH